MHALAQRARWLAPLSWAGLIFFLSHQPSLPTPPLFFEGMDKIVHAGVYGVFTLLLFWALRGAAGRRLSVSVALAVAYGATDEYHQSFVPGRTADLWDLCADAVGALIVAWALRWYLHRTSERRGKAPTHDS